MEIFENISPNFDAKGTKKERAVPFCVPLILEAYVPASFLKKRNAFLQCFEIPYDFQPGRLFGRPNKLSSDDNKHFLALLGVPKNDARE